MNEPVKGLLKLSCACALLSSCSSHAQPAPDRRVIFSGRNVYSPSLTYDEFTRTFKMWYGGWQSEADYPHDKIYYRESKDSISWSAPRTVLEPSQLPIANFHVNDPSVVVTLNSITKKIQYTMFYTVCVGTCTKNSENQIWSSVSSDGLRWIRHKPLIRTEGAAVPSAVAFDGAGQSEWRVYYSNTSESRDTPKHIYMAVVDANRNILTKDKVAYTYLGPGVIANPEVRKIAGVWNLLFNVYHTRPGAKRNTADIYLAQSPNPTHWRAGSERPLIVNDPKGPVCATVAPTVLSFHGSLLLQFGQARYGTSGACDFSVFETMRQVSAKAGWQLH